jgi:hypothetical protein
METDGLAHMPTGILGRRAVTLGAESASERRQASPAGGAPLDGMAPGGFRRA